MQHPSLYGDEELTRIFLEKLFAELDLSDEDREIFVLRFGHNLYYSEIGEFIGEKYRGKPYSEGTIRHRIHRIRSKLRKIIKKLV